MERKTYTTNQQIYFNERYRPTKLYFKGDCPKCGTHEEIEGCASSAHYVAEVKEQSNDVCGNCEGQLWPIREVLNGTCTSGICRSCGKESIVSTVPVDFTLEVSDSEIHN